MAAMPPDRNSVAARLWGGVSVGAQGLEQAPVWTKKSVAWLHSLARLAAAGSAIEAEIVGRATSTFRVRVVCQLRVRKSFWR